jgi:hypothetical protein
MVRQSHGPHVRRIQMIARKHGGAKSRAENVNLFTRGNATAAVPCKGQPDVEHFLARPDTFIRLKRNTPGEML